MISGLRDIDGIAFDLVHQTMFWIDPARPVSGEIVPQRLGFPETLVLVPLDILDERVDALERSLAGPLPIQVVFPSVF